MKKLLKSSVASAAATWAWRNRSTIMTKVRGLTGRASSRDSSGHHTAGDGVSTEANAQPA